MIKYLSPSSLALWESDVDAFYCKYFTKTPRMPQTKPMSVGSAFDAEIKAYLYKRLVDAGDPAYERDALFEAQVDFQNRDFAGPAGHDCFEQYKSSGALADLVLELGDRVGQPMFEGKIQGTIEVNTNGKPLAVAILGIPDLFFMNKEGLRIVDDWKVNGYCSNGNTSPTKGYLRLRPGGQSHRDCVASYYKGMEINAACYLEDCNKQWADQLSTYAWLAGEPIGSENWIAGIDQLACNRHNIRVAEHRCRVSRAWQLRLAERYAEAWEILHSGWIFRNMSRDESLAREEQMKSEINSSFKEFLNGAAST